MKINEEEHSHFRKFENPVFSLVFTYNSVDAKKNEDLQTVCNEAGFDFKNLTYSRQTHSDIVRLIDKNNIATVEEADAMVTSIKNVPLAIFTADCVPIAFIDEKNRAVALAHAGWRGTYADIGGKTLKKMKENFGTSPEDVMVFIGPSIGKCCFEVGDDLYFKFMELLDSDKKDRPAEWYELKDGRYHIDLWKVNMILLAYSGVKEENIHSMNICTSCNSDRYFSYRKNDQTEKRIGTVLQLKGGY